MAAPNGKEGAGQRAGNGRNGEGRVSRAVPLEHEFHMLLTVRALHGRLLENAFARGIDKGKDGVQRIMHKLPLLPLSSSGPSK